VVVGQKVKARVETSETLVANSTYWSSPSGNPAIKDYITTESVGRVVNLSTFDYTSEEFAYYHYVKNSNTSSVGALFDLVDVNGKTHYGKSAAASYYVESPTVGLQARKDGITRITGNLVHEPIISLLYKKPDTGPPVNSR
jgi:hypothetical protein